MEIMESYEETRLGPAHVSDQCDLHDVKIHETNLSAKGSTLLGNKQNFDFGAEIVGMQTTIVTERECDVKTNNVNIATTATLATVAVAASTSPIENQVLNIETPLNVSELPSKNKYANDERIQIEDINNDDDDGDSYQSDDDIDDDTNAAESQQEGSPNMRNDASQDSDESTSDSDFSDLSGLSDISGREWKPISARPINWVQKQIHAGANPRDLLSQMLPSNAQPIAPGVNDMLLWRILASMLSEPPRRQKLRYINTFEDVIQLIQQSKNIIVLTGAGVSVSCGIPDFRSSDGIYSRLAKDFPNLPDPQAMFDINYFSRDPRPFFKFAREIYPGQFKPSPCHRFIKLLEGKQKLLRNYTQNIDTLEQVAGIKNVIECHGSFSTASCTKCKVKCTADAIREDIFSQRIPVCHRCQPNVHQSTNASDAVSDEDLRKIVENGIMKPDIVFFGEGLPEEFHTVMASDKDLCDLLIVIGSSLKVRPVALIPSSIPANVPQILINREQLHHLEFDVELLGDSDVIINQLCHRLGDDWSDICFDNIILKESKELLPLEETTDTTDDGEEDGQQMLDTDTQSVKSSASTDLALRSAGTYSDSGFESSTSSGMVLAKTKATTAATKIEANEAVAKIKHTILELNQQLTTSTTTKTMAIPTTKIKENNLDAIRVNYIEEPNDAVNFENHSFQPFNARVSEQNHTTYEMNARARHMSIDISKDSGIQGDSSNSGLITNIIGTLPPPVADFGETGGTTVIDESAVASTACIENIHHTPADASPPTQKPTTPTTDVPQTTNVRNSANGDCQKSTSAQTRHNTKKYRTAAERLHKGTYYVHDTTSAYVFPGAQVSWWSDGEDEDDVNDIIGNEYDAEDQDPLEDASGAPLSPLMPPSVEAEVVSEITTTSAFAICAKPRTLPAITNNSAANEAQTQAEVSSCKTVNNSSNKTTSTDTTTRSINASNDDAMHNITNERVNMTALPPQSSPQKRLCECPTAFPNYPNKTIGSTSCCCSDMNSDKCECSPPPLKRKRSTDNENLLRDPTTKNVNEDLVKATNNSDVMDSKIVTAMKELSSGDTGDTPSMA